MSDHHEQARARLATAVTQDRLRLTRFVQRKLGAARHQDAEDILSDVVLRLFERADVLAEVENITAYLFRALANNVTEFFRRRKDLLMDDLSPTKTNADSDNDNAPATPETELEQSRLRQRLDWALDQLSQAERMVWVAVEVEGWQFRELAEAWGEPLGTLLSRKARASKALQKLLAAEGRDNLERKR